MGRATDASKTVTGTVTGKERKTPASPLTQARRVVIKVGSALLVEAASGRVNRAWLETLAVDIARLRSRGYMEIGRASCRERV